MESEKMRAMAERCRDLVRVVARDDVREQLRQWAHDFEAEAEAHDNAQDRSALPHRVR